MNYEHWLDDSGLRFKDDLPEGKGAFDLTAFTMGPDQNPPTFNDVQGLDNDNFIEIQVDKTQALKHYREVLQCLSGAKYEKELAARKDKCQKLLLKKRHKANAKLAKQEATLAQVSLIKYIAWHPELSVAGNPIKYLDNTLKGHYVAKYLDDGDNVMHDMEMMTDWAEKN